jgi:hypothetical protein
MLKFMFKYVVLSLFIILDFTTGSAQDGYVGAGLTFGDIPAYAVIGYNDQYFGVRFSVDDVFVGPEIYGRYPLDEANSSLYLGTGLGLHPYLYGYVNGPPGTPPGTPISGIVFIGGEWRIEDVGLSFEYAPSFPISGNVGFEGLLGALHFKLGLNYHF